MPKEKLQQFLTDLGAAFLLGGMIIAYNFDERAQKQIDV